MCVYTHVACHAPASAYLALQRGVTAWIRARQGRLPVRLVGLRIGIDEMSASKQPCMELEAETRPRTGARADGRACALPPVEVAVPGHLLHSVMGRVVAHCEPD